MYPPVKNVIVVMFDTMQYNYLGCYGNDWIKTPNLDRFAREGIVFDNCYIEGLPTIPSRRGMHTGRYTLPVKGWSPLDMDDTTIADLCWGTNIDTAFIFDSGPHRLPKFGFTRGFDKVWFLHGHQADHVFYGKDDLIHYKPEDFFEEKSIEKGIEQYGEKVMEVTLREMASFLKQRQYWKTDEDQNVAKVMKEAVSYLSETDRNKPFFLWIDSFDPHEPWDPPSVYDPEMKCPYDPDYKGKDEVLPIVGPVEGVYTKEQLHHIRMLYAEKITMCDKWFGYLMDNVKRMGLEENTLIMVVSDHGAPLGEGEHGHGIMRKCRPWPYEELVHGVMLMKGPGIKAGQRTKAFTQSCDVAPTVCDFLGLGVRDFHQGFSLLPLAHGEVQKVRDFAIAGYYKYSWSIITDDWSYIHWLKKEEGTIADSMFELYGRTTLQHAGHLKPMGSVSGGTSAEDAMKKVKEGKGGDAAHKEYQEAASIDGEDQWTCTPTAAAALPEIDELYDRKKDLFQLHNVIKEHPDVAKKLFARLREFLGEIRTS